MVIAIVIETVIVTVIVIGFCLHKQYINAWRIYGVPGHLKFQRFVEPVVSQGNRLVQDPLASQCTLKSP